jgi:hypothetical protein
VMLLRIETNGGWLHWNYRLVPSVVDWNIGVVVNWSRGERWSAHPIVVHYRVMRAWSEHVGCPFFASTSLTLDIGATQRRAIDDDVGVVGGSSCKLLSLGSTVKRRGQETLTSTI